jgi:Flp pilus assembly pilin Flp
MFPRLMDSVKKSEQGQDLAEYCLMIAFIALLGLVLFSRTSGGLQAVWGTANGAVSSANSAVSGAAIGAGAVTH